MDRSPAAGVRRMSRRIKSGRVSYEGRVVLLALLAGAARFRLRALSCSGSDRATHTQSRSGPSRC